MSKAIAKLVTDLGWSLWAELGVPGVLRNHAHVAIDPEPLIVFSPWLFRDDARLQDEVVRWCVAHADRISASRLYGLLKTASPDVSAAFNEMATNLRPRRVVDDGESDGDEASTTKPLALPTKRSALIREVAFLAGGARRTCSPSCSGTKAAGSSRLTCSTSLQQAQRGRVLGELADAGVVSAARQNAVGFRLQAPTLLGQLLGGSGSSRCGLRCWRSSKTCSGCATTRARAKSS
ncbi:MAG: hypothetical protein WKF45_09660 [Ilumatobacteraceae bacterium]